MGSVGRFMYKQATGRQPCVGRERGEDREERKGYDCGAWRERQLSIHQQTHRTSQPAGRPWRGLDWTGQDMRASTYSFESTFLRPISEGQ